MHELTLSRYHHFPSPGVRHRDRGLLSDTVTHSALQINVSFPSIMLLFKEIATEITQTECSEGAGRIITWGTSCLYNFLISDPE